MNIDPLLEDSIAAHAQKDSGYAIAYAILAHARVCDSLATWLKYLGTGDAGTTMGAIEFLAVELRDAIRSISERL